MATSVAECDEIIAAADKANRCVSVAHSDLFYPSFTKAQQMVESGAIGKFRGMRIFLSTPIDYITSKPDHWAHKLPGGVLGETGPQRESIRVLDLLVAQLDKESSRSKPASPIAS
jgi:predicted dehydrogenase